MKCKEQYTYTWTTYTHGLGTEIMKHISGAKNISLLHISLKNIVILILSTCNFGSSFVTSIAIGQFISESLPGIMTDVVNHSFVEN